MNYIVVIGEFTGMFILVFTILLTVEYIENIYLRLFFQGLAFYIGINIAILFSSAHLNPVRSLLEYIYNNLTFEEFIVYTISQIIAGITALIIFDTFITKKKKLMKIYFPKKS
jgi:glycerol uptake facilitator-like aquaporin